MPPPRHHYFNLRVPSGMSVDAVIDAAEAIVPPSELYSVQHMGGLEFQIWVNTASAVRKFLDTNGLRIQSHIVTLEPANKQYVSIAIFFLATFVTDDEPPSSVCTEGLWRQIHVEAPQFQMFQVWSSPQWLVSIRWSNTSCHDFMFRLWNRRNWSICCAMPPRLLMLRLVWRILMELCSFRSNMSIITKFRLRWRYTRLTTATSLSGLRTSTTSKDLRETAVPAIRCLQLQGNFSWEKFFPSSPASCSTWEKALPAADVYCFFQGPETGKIIACNNPSCTFKWFHFLCVESHECQRQSGIVHNASKIKGTSMQGVPVSFCWSGLLNDQQWM